MEWPPYNLTGHESEVDAETFQYFHLKGVFFRIRILFLNARSLSVEVKIFTFGLCMLVFGVFKC
jgi:hypothetical protein